MAAAIQPVIKGARYFLAHTPGLVAYGSKPAREIARAPALAESIRARLRSYEDALSYPPNQVFLGAIDPDELSSMSRPWFLVKKEPRRRHPHGEIMPEEEFYAFMKHCDSAGLLWLEEEFLRTAGQRLQAHPLIKQTDPGGGKPFSTIEAQVGAQAALPLCLRDGRMVGCVFPGDKEDRSLAADLLLENLACKATASMALRTLLDDTGVQASAVDYLLNSGEEAVGDRYQRGGGNLAKAIGEACGCANAAGVDVKGFCAGPNHALLVAGSLIAGGVFRNVVVVGGCSLAKLGMKFQGHLKHGYPILEDVLAGFAILVARDDGRHPRLRLDSAGLHRVGTGSSQQAIFAALVAEPLERLRLRFGDVDKYATELHNPELTEPSGSGNVPLTNYRLIAALAAKRGEIGPGDIPTFVERHGMPGYAPTQGHVASAVPFLGHALDRIMAGALERAMFVAKGSLFLGRMTQMADGVSFIVERNPEQRKK
ncbi:MAG TPA: glycine/sarcosine/betaine reductase complex component C subunit beta [Candidatus Acidoferrales bacterium]|nr:glycine/sarcosine/betaine reductase complex component C subunit beta [Candidatus Acidoferrales bacterium]